ncbi:hypothetical protein [Rhodoglobus aureus]|uniref:Uncharacterized protein n=1 Tax=Rhodoglobus aureus TaxID=191497 RepID=A0ABN1VIK5_9MICO
MTAEVLLPAPKRLSLPLSAQDIRALELIRGSAQHLSALPGRVSEQASEAELVHAVFEAGLARVREAIELAAYRELANDEEYTNYRTQRRAAASRRRAE